MLATRDLANRATRSIVLALPDSVCTHSLHLDLHRAGWRVWCVDTPCELRHIALRTLPTVVVMPIDGMDESGWLTCAKLRRAQPRLRVILVGELTEERLRFAQFVGAELVSPKRIGSRILT